MRDLCGWLDELNRDKGPAAGGGRQSRSGKSRHPTREIADDYIALCRAPMRDVRGWLGELDRDKGGGVGRWRGQVTRKDRNHDSSETESSVGKYLRICNDPLSKLRGGLDAPGQRGDAYGVLARSRASSGRYDCLRSVRAEGVGRRGYRTPLGLFRQAARGVAGRSTPRRPLFGPIGRMGAMSAAQRIDYKDACHGRMTWGEYFRRWENALSL